MPKLAVTQAKWAPKWAFVLWVLGFVVLFGVEGRPGSVYGGVTPLTSAVLFGPLPLASVYQAAFILRYPGTAARHNIQQSSRYTRRADYSAEAAPKYAVLSLVYGLAYVVIPLVVFGSWPPT